MPEYFYRGQPLSAYSLWELGDIEKSLNDALAKREEARQHPKFNVDREISGKKVLKIPFQPPNVEFLKLKDAIEKEIRERQKVNNNA